MPSLSPGGVCSYRSYPGPPSPNNQMPPDVANVPWEGAESRGPEVNPGVGVCRAGGGQLASPKTRQVTEFKVYLTRAESSKL